MLTGTLGSGDLPPGSTLDNVQFYNAEQRINTAVAYQQGFVAAYSKVYVSLLDFIAIEVVIFKDTDSAANAVRNAADIIEQDAQNSDASNWTITEISAPSVGEEAKAFEVDLDIEFFERVTFRHNLIVLRNLNVLGYVRTVSQPSPLSIGPLPSLAEKLDSRILSEVRSPHGPTTLTPGSP